MEIVRMECRIFFADEKVKKAFESLKASKTEDRKLYEFIARALNDIEKDAFCGIQFQKKLIPKDYVRKYGKMDNMWKYDLPNAWRLIYTVKSEGIFVLGIVLEWMDHKNYERRFGYKCR
jgi:Txe/YoeB family toxin of Txe-Axe toxin-antitoxin module